MMGRAGPRWSTAVGLLLAAVGFSITARLTADNSLLTHVATGRLILDSGTVPTVDPYSSHFAGRPWTVQSWFASVVYAGVVDVGGFAWLRVAHGLLGCALTLGFWRLTAPARSLAVRVSLTIGVLIVAEAFWSPRPLLFGLIGLLMVVAVAEDVVDPRWLVPVMWVWVNSHGSFPLAAVFWGATVAGSFIDQWLVADGVERPDDVARRRLLAALESMPRRLWLMGLWLAVGTAAGAVGPLGPRLLVFPFTTVLRRRALDRVVEWQPPTFTSAAELAYLGLLAGVVLAATRLRSRSESEFGWRHLVPAMLFLAGGFLAVRNIAPGALVVLVLLARGLGPGDRRLSIWSGGRASGPSLLAAVGAIVLVVTLASVAASGPGVNLDRYPVSAVDYLDERGLVAIADVSLVHREAVGNYLTFRYGDQASVYMDDRFDFYPVDRTTDHLDLVYGGRYQKVLAKVNASVVLWQSDALFADWLRQSDRWVTAFEDDEWLIACRRASPSFDRCMS